jgi:hypothetical protein
VIERGSDVVIGRHFSKTAFYTSETVGVARQGGRVPSGAVGGEGGAEVDPDASARDPGDYSDDQVVSKSAYRVRPPSTNSVCPVM